MEPTTREAIRTRAATLADSEFVAALAPRFVEHGVAGGHTREEVVEGTARVLRRALTRPSDDVLFLIAEDGAQPVGFIYAVTENDYFTDEPYVHIEEIAVTTSGNGVGTILLDAAESWARERGCRLVTLNVVEANPAERLYGRRGYVVGNLHLVKRLDGA